MKRLYLAQVILKSAKECSAPVKTDEDKESNLGAERFEKFFSLESLQGAVANHIVVVRDFKHRRDAKDGGVNPRSEAPNVRGKLRPPTVEEWDHALRVIINTTQRAAFGELLRNTRTEPELAKEVQHSAQHSPQGLTTVPPQSIP